MLRLIKRRNIQGASKKGARVGTAPLVSPASASASAPPLPRFAAPTRTPSGDASGALAEQMVHESVSLNEWGAALGHCSVNPRPVPRAWRSGIKEEPRR
jgi:hypothetical protein